MGKGEPPVPELSLASGVRSPSGYVASSQVLGLAPPTAPSSKLVLSLGFPVGLSGQWAMITFPASVMDGWQG